MKVDECKIKYIYTHTGTGDEKASEQEIDTANGGVRDGDIEREKLFFIIYVSDFHLENSFQYSLHAVCFRKFFFFLLLFRSISFFVSCTKSIMRSRLGSCVLCTFCIAFCTCVHKIRARHSPAFPFHSFALIAKFSMHLQAISENLCERWEHG